MLQNRPPLPRIMTTSNIYRYVERDMPVPIPQATLALPPPLIVTLLHALPTPQTLLSFLLATRQAYDLYTTYQTQIQHSLVLHLIATLPDPESSLRVATRLKKQFNHTWPEIYTLFNDRRSWVREAWLGWEVYLDCLVPRPSKGNLLIPGTDPAIFETLTKEGLADVPPVKSEYISDLTPILRLSLPILHKLSFPPPPPPNPTPLTTPIAGSDTASRQTSSPPLIPTTTNTSPPRAACLQPPLPNLAARIFYLRMGYVIATRARTWQEADWMLNKCRNGCTEVLELVGQIESEVPEDELREGGFVRVILKTEGKVAESANTRMGDSRAQLRSLPGPISSSVAASHPNGLTGQSKNGEEFRSEGRLVWCDESWATDLVGIEGVRLVPGGRR